MADTRELYIKQFPKHERYALASEIRLCMYRILGIVIETNHKHYKKTTLTELDIEVDKLRSYLRLSANPELKYLSVDKYGNWAAMVDEIGRMVGGWIQSVSNIKCGFFRGGNWNNTSNAGVFYLNGNNPRSNSNDNIGFRPA